MQTLLDRMDRTSMHSGLGSKSDLFADHRIDRISVECAMVHENKGWGGKTSARESGKGLLPDEVLWRRKIPVSKDL